ncbi:MAG: putative DNA binding domain-containing protein [bacterium]|nr:putative DNA binding domain-containing protein [bacterium]
MSALEERLQSVLPALRSAGTDLQRVEVKNASGGFPKSVLKSVSAFANWEGGLVILGLAEPDFEPSGIDAPRLASSLASACADNLQPAIRPEIEICTVDGIPVVVAAVDEISPGQKPCIVMKPDHLGGAYVRTHDGNRLLTEYEHYALFAAKGQPTEDERAVDGAQPADLDSDLVDLLIQRVRVTRGPIFRDADDARVLRLLGVLTNANGRETPTLAGLLALGAYPQQFAPRLNVTFVAFATETGEPMADGTRYRDSQQIDGPISEILALAADALRRNMRRRAVVVGLGREDHWDYPLEAVREVVVNALMHRDYHSSVRGQPVVMALYPDRLEIRSPGGLYGAFSPESLLTEPVTASRNARLAKLLQDVSTPRSNRTVCENVGTGLVSVAKYLRDAGLEPPEIDYSLTEFRVIFRNHTVLDSKALDWLSTTGGTELSDRQRLGLAHAWRHGRIDNRCYRALTGCDPATATTEMSDLGRRGMLRKIGGRRWAEWVLADHLQSAEDADDHGRRGLEPARPLPSRAAPLSIPPTASPLARGGETGATRAEAALTTRQLEMVETLAEGPTTSKELAERFGVTRGAVLIQLRRLEERGLVSPTEEGRRSRNQRWILNRPTSAGSPQVADPRSSRTNESPRRR